MYRIEQQYYNCDQPIIISENENKKEILKIFDKLNRCNLLDDDFYIYFLYDNNKIIGFK